MDDNPGDQLTEKIKYCQKTARNLKEDLESLLLMQKSTGDSTGDSDLSVKQTPPSNDVTKHLLDIDLALESIQRQFKLALEKCLSTQSDLPTSEDCPLIQSDANQKQIAKVTHNEPVKLSNNNNDNGQNEDKLNSIVQALFTGTLPDDFYLHLISVMSIQDCLISNRLVCSFWNELVLEQCSNLKSLKLFETFDILMKYGEMLLNYEKTEDTSLTLKSIGDDLLFEGLKVDHAQLVSTVNLDVILTRERKLEASKVLTDLFPKIEELVLCPETDTLMNIGHLLQFYAEQLTSLTMTWFDKLYENAASKLRAFSFPKLKSLNAYSFSPEEGQLLSLLPQLESLTLGVTKISLETLLRTGTQLRELNIGRIETVYTAPVEAFSKRPPINSNLRKFTFVYSKIESQILEFISQNMTSLECLKLFLCYLDILPSMTSYLVPLPQLHSLTIEAPVSFFLLNDNQFAAIQPLPSVRHLKLLLWNYDSLPPESMDRFSRALFAAFPNVEQVLIAFVGHKSEGRNGLVNAATLAAFEDFTGKQPNTVQLFRSKTMSKCTTLPNVVAPLLGHHRQEYEEYLEEEELFGVAICKLTASLDPRQGEDGPNLKIILRPANRLSAMSNLLQLLESQVFAFTYEMVKTMIEHMVDCALKFAPSQGALFIVTCNCVLFLLGCRVADKFESDKVTAFINLKGDQVYGYLKMQLDLVEHFMTQQLNDKNLLLQLCTRMVSFLKEKFHSSNDAFPPSLDPSRIQRELGEYRVLTILLKLANYYQTQQLTVFDAEEELLLQIDNLIDNQLKTFESQKRLDAVIIKFIRSKNRVHRVEMLRALLRCFEGTDDCFKLVSSEIDGDSSEVDSSEVDSSEVDSSEVDSSEVDSSDSDSSDSSSSSSESEPEL